MKELEINGYNYHYEQDNKRWVAFKTTDKDLYNSEDRIKVKVIYSDSYTTLRLFLSGKY